MFLGFTLPSRDSSTCFFRGDREALTALRDAINKELEAEKPGNKLSNEIRDITMYSTQSSDNLRVSQMRRGAGLTVILSNESPLADKEEDYIEYKTTLNQKIEPCRVSGPEKLLRGIGAFLREVGK